METNQEPASQGSETSAFPTATDMTPIESADRLPALDFLRGIAIFGILMVNMAFFSLPFMEAVWPSDKSTWPTGEWAAYLVVKTLFEYKFVSLFSLLFGAGLIMMMARARVAGVSFAARYFRRIGLLGAVGLVHGFVLWYGDILFIYALIGTVLFFLRTFRPRTLFITAAVLLVCASLFSAGLIALQMNAPPADEAVAAVDASSAPPRGFDAIVAAQWSPDQPVWMEGEQIAYAEGPASHAYAFRAVSFAMCVAFTMLGFGWHILAFFLIGAGLMKAGFFAAEGRSLQGRLGIVAIPIGLALEVTSACLIGFGAAELGWDDMLAGGLHEFGAATLCLGYVGLGSWIANASGGNVASAFRPVGRMALTNYLLSTVIVTFLMYHWGLGWFGDVSRVQMIGIAVSVYALLQIVSALWLAQFRFGPFEWVWRSLTYWKAQPMRRELTSAS